MSAVADPQDIPKDLEMQPDTELTDENGVRENEAVNEDDEEIEEVGEMEGEEEPTHQQQPLEDTAVEHTPEEADGDSTRTGNPSGIQNGEKVDEQGQIGIESTEGVTATPDSKPVPGGVKRVLKSGVFGGKYHVEFRLNPLSSSHHTNTLLLIVREEFVKPTYLSEVE